MIKDITNEHDRRRGVISLETAIKLKESGWKGESKAGYLSDGNTAFMVIANQNIPYFGDDIDKFTTYYPAPTLQELGTSEVEQVAQKFINGK